MSPTSNAYLIPAVITLVDQAHPTSVLDVGPGCSKFGVLCREYVPTLEHIEAVEAWEPYVTPMMRAIYDHVHVCDMRALSDDVLAAFDLVLMSEVLEHLPKEDGMTLLKRIPGRVVITTPQEFFPSVNYPPTERHLSLWSVEDFGDRVDVDVSQLGGVVVRLKPL